MNFDPIYFSSRSFNQVKNPFEENENGFDIYWTLNTFANNRRVKENLTHINVVCVDIDDLDEDEFEERIAKCPLPSLVVRTARGFHCYWYLSEPIEVKDKPLKWAEKYRQFIETSIEPILGSDPRAKDVCRLLRPPMYKYWKQTNGDFIVYPYFESDHCYYWEALQKLFRKKSKNKFHEPQQIISTPSPTKAFNQDNKKDFWVKANSIPVEEGLKRLSNHPVVNFERFSTKPITRNEKRILINGKEHHMWIDRDGKIGSNDRGGPSIPNWIYYYQQSWASVATILKEVFPDYVN